MKKFVFHAKPRTRLDAYPLLLATQDVLRRVSEKEIRVVSKREADMARRLEEVSFQREQLSQDLAIAKREIDHLKMTAKLQMVTSMMIPKGDNAEAQEAYKQAQVELESYKKEQQRMRDENQETLDQLAALRLEVLARQKKEAQLESQIRQQKQQQDAILRKMDSQAGTNKLDLWSMWPDVDRKEIMLKKALSDKNLLALCTAAGILRAWTTEGTGSIHKVTEMYVKDTFNKDANALAKLCKLLGRDTKGTLDFVSAGLQAMAGNPALHEVMRQEMPELFDQLIALDIEGPNFLEILGHRWLRSLPSAEGLSQSMHGCVGLCGGRGADASVRALMHVKRSWRRQRGERV